MLQQSNLGNVCKHLLFFAIAVIAFGITFVPTAKAQAITWTVTIDVSKLNVRPVYTVTRLPLTGGCSYINDDPENLHICPGDTIQWQAITTTDASGKMQSDMRVYLKDSVLLKDGAPSQRFHAMDGQPDGGKTAATAGPGVPYEYCVAVYDKVNTRLYLHDPKIIIGSVNITALVHEIIEDCDHLSDQLQADSAAETQAKKLCQKVKMLKDELNLQ